MSVHTLLSLFNIGKFPPVPRIILNTKEIKALHALKVTKIKQKLHLVTEIISMYVF